MERTDERRELRGCMTALVTPFRDGQVDWDCWDALLDRQIDEVDWLVPCGTTGESPTLSSKEHARLIETAIERSDGRLPVMAGTGCNCTADTVALTRWAATAGATAALIVTPYYNRPTPEGLYRHYAEIAEAVDLPIVLYNVPTRTGVSLTVDTIVRLRSRYANITAIKHATGSVAGITELASRCDITILSGDDSLTWPLMALGASGLISVVSNLAPGLVKSLTEAALRGDAVAALRFHRKLHDLAEGIGRFGPNPLPIKTAMAVCGLLAEEFRLPLCPLDEQARREIEGVLRRHELFEARAI